MSQKETKERRITKFDQCRRVIAAGLLGLLVKNSWEVEETKNATSGEVVDHKSGLVVVANHPSKMDGMLIAVSLFRDPELRKKNMVVPVADHQYLAAAMVNMVLGTKLDLVPVVTPDTVKKHPRKEQDQGKGLIKYLKKSARVLKDGGIVILFPQAERRQKVGKVLSRDNAVKMLAEFMERRKVSWNLWPIGISILGVNPIEAKGLNIGKTFVLRAGEKIPGSQLKEGNETGYANSDATVFNLLKELVDPEYREEEE